MFQRTVIHVLSYKHSLWQIKFEGEQESHSVYGNKFTAVETARGLAKQHFAMPARRPPGRWVHRVRISVRRRA
jgi:hypothetical protein